MPFQCSKCSHNFGQKDLLKQHVSAVHKKNIFRCSSCNQRFSQKNLLNTHIRCVHEQKTHFSVLFVVVLSDSMEPAFHRGDVVFLPIYKQEDIRVGETIVFKIEGTHIPIVHRVLNLHEKEDGTVIFLTERDNNLVDEGNCDIFAINIILKKTCFISLKKILCIKKYSLHCRTIQNKTAETIKNSSKCNKCKS